MPNSANSRSEGRETGKVALDLSLVLPDVRGIADDCVVRLAEILEGKPGVELVHILSALDGKEASLCIHFDPAEISLQRIGEIARIAGAELSDRYAHVRWDVTGITHERRARSVSEDLARVPGVLESEASAAGVVRIEFDKSQIDEAGVLDALKKLGVTRELGDTRRGSKKSAHRDHVHGAVDEHDTLSTILGPQTELIFAIASGLFLAQGFVVERFFASAPPSLTIASFGFAYFFGGIFTLREAFDSLKRRKFEIDSLMLVAAAGAAALGAWAEGALLLFLFSLGHALEHYAMARAKRAIEALAELAPETATVLRDGVAREIRVEALVVGDVVMVAPHGRLPADGFIVKGVTAINQAPVTGESVPVDKTPVEDRAAARAKPNSIDANSRVFAGTINGNGAIEVEVTRRSSETTLAKVVQMVSEAEAQKSPTQQFTDKFERMFVPAVLMTAFVLLFAWVVVDEPFQTSLYRALAVLVAASPCALAIATPSAVLAGVARAARGGVLVKGGAPLENLGSLKTIAFDKTGTLTEGRARITDVLPGVGVSEAELLAVAVAVEALSDHPLAQAITRDGRDRLGKPDAPAMMGLSGQGVRGTTGRAGRQPTLEVSQIKSVAGRGVTTRSGEPPRFEVSELTSLTGRGVVAQVNGEPTWIGKAEMFGVGGVPPIDEPTKAEVAWLRALGRTTMVVRKGERNLGIIGLMDTPRASARGALKRLRELGISRMVMISGDHRLVASAVAKEVGLDEAWGDLMPEDKVAAIKAMSAEGKVAMVGDGVNDAPAMASAAVGIAMGAAGSDTAIETADVALMADDLSHLPFAVGLSRAAHRAIRQNLFFSLGVVALLVPATIFGLPIGPAVVAHEGSTVLVVLNALRLLAYRTSA